MSWRSSRSFEQFLVRMMGVMAFGTAGVMGVLLLVKKNHDFGKRCISDPVHTKRTPHTQRTPHGCMICPLADVLRFDSR